MPMVPSIIERSAPVSWPPSVWPLVHAGSIFEIAAHRYMIPSWTRISRTAQVRTGVAGAASGGRRHGTKHAIATTSAIR